MVLGVIAFSFANGSLTSLLTTYDYKMVSYLEKLETLNQIQNKYNLPPRIYTDLKKSIGYDFQNSNAEERQFVDQLPEKLKIEVNLFIFEDRYKNIYMLKNKTSAFISWTCPRLKPQFYQHDSPVFMEGDEANSVHFMFQGECSYVLMEYNNKPFIMITRGH